MNNLKKIPFQKKPVFHYFLLALFTLIAYWPISLNLFSLKNDAVVYFLPYRYNISYAIQQGEFPFWSPYLYMGFPLHADMQSGAWNPVVLLISVVRTYNMTLLQLETLLYIFLAGVGMWKFLRTFIKDQSTCLVFASCYITCGYLTDSGQFIVWIASAAFVPFVFLYYYRLLRYERIVDALKCAIAVFFLFTAGYPSFVIFSSYIMGFGLVCHILYKLRNKTTQFSSVLRMIGLNVLLVILIGLLTAPALVSYAEFIPHFARGAAISVAEAQTNPFCVNCALSYLFPFSVSRTTPLFNTDGTMRNAFVGLFTLIFAVYGFTRRLSAFEIFVLSVTVLCFLFSLGEATPIRQWSYNLFPGMNYFRHPGNMRLFTSIGLIVFAAINFQKISTLISIFSLKKLRLITIALILICCTCLLFNLREFSSFQFKISSGNLRSGFQEFMNNLSLNQILIIESILQLIFLVPFLFVLKKFNKRYVYAFIIGNSLVFMQPSLASTFVRKEPPGNINAFISQQSKGQPLENLKYAVKENRTLDSANDPRLYGYPSWYNKRITDPIDIFTPAYLIQQMNFSSDSILREKLWSFTPITISNRADTAVPKTENIQPRKFSTTEFSFVVNNNHESNVGILQNHYIHWRAYIDGKEVPVLLWNKAFMSVKIPQGTHLVQLQYKPENIVTIIYISLAIWLFSVAFLVYFSVVKQK